MRKLKSVEKLGDCEAKVYFNTEYGEYTCKFYRAGAHLPEADYYTNDYSDAVGTATTELLHMSKRKIKRNPRKKSATKRAAKRAAKHAPQMFVVWARKGRGKKHYWDNDKFIVSIHAAQHYAHLDAAKRYALFINKKTRPGVQIGVDTYRPK